MFGMLGMFDPHETSTSTSTFSPYLLFVSGEQGAWYDPSDFRSMFQDSAGTTPVTAVEQPVGLILDKSGNGNHASQSTTTSRPILRQEAGGQYYLAFDGADDWLQTANINFSATNKVTMIAGVRKITESFYPFLELSAAASANNGAFQLYLDASTALGSASRGTTFITANKSGYAAPITLVMAGVADISAPSLNIRVNSTLQNTNTSSQGTGDYGTYPLYIGRRGGTTLPFNGRIYSLIIRGALTSGTYLTQTEAWVNGKTGAY